MISSTIPVVGCVFSRILMPAREYFWAHLEPFVCVCVFISHSHNYM